MLGPNRINQIKITDTHTHTLKALNMIAKPKVTIVGSMNVDIFLTMFRMPDLGETIASDTMKKTFGGKVSFITSRAIMEKSVQDELSYLAQILHGSRLKTLFINPLSWILGSKSMPV